MMKHIHIGYGDSATGCILEAIRNHGLQGDGAVPSRDDFTQGPISDSLTRDGLKQRVAYWESVDKVLGFRFDAKHFYHKSIQQLDDLKADEITFWVGDSCHDILATGWLINYLAPKSFKWFIVDLADVDLKDLPNGSPVVNLAMYAPEKLKELYHHRRPLSKNDFDYYSSVWNKAAQENSHFRIHKGSEIVSVDEDYYDAYILSCIPHEYVTTSKIIGDILKDGRHRISDTTVEWNIKKMVKRNQLEFKDDLIRQKN